MVYHIMVQMDSTRWQHYIEIGLHKSRIVYYELQFYTILVHGLMQSLAFNLCAAQV